MKIEELIVGLPGGGLVRRGLTDYRAGRRSAESYLVQIARPRLTNYGLLPPENDTLLEPELELYRLLQQEEGDAYARYNSLLRELDSFAMALDRRVREARQRKT